jgi:uncharacterized membrane protein
MSKTIVALYDDFSTAERVVQELVDAGFARENISIVANDAAGEYSHRYTRTEDLATDYDDDDVSAGEGAGFGAVVGTLVGLGVALIPGVGPVLAAGPFAAAVMAGIGAAAGAVTGGVVAGLVDFGIPEDEAHVYAEGLRRGGTLVSATVGDEYTTRVEEVMNRHNPVDIEHRADNWRQQGWDSFETESSPYDADQIAREREMYGSTTSSGMSGSGMAGTGTSGSAQYRGVRTYESDDDTIS